MRWLLPGLLLLFVACQASPEEVLAEARQAAQRKDFERYQALLTERTGALLADLRRVSAESRGDYTYLSEKDLFDLLPAGDVQDVAIKGRLARLTVGRSAKRSEDLILLREVDGWRIDLYDSERFWAPLARKEDSPGGD